MKRVIILCALLVGLALIGGSALAQDATAEATQQAGGVWQQIPLEGAVCARGTPYRFFVHEGSPDKLMVYFQGGGACWNADTCQEGGTFDDSVEADELERYAGIFDFADARNPVADFSVVVVAYCTGDVHTGASTTEFSVEETTFTQNFAGFTNAQAVLDWVYERYPQPEQVIVTGSSAGAYGAIFNAPYILDHYPDAQVTIFGDAGIGVVAPDWNGFETWGVDANVADVDGYTGVTAGADFTNSLYTAAANAFPQAVVAEYTSFGDQVQTGFYILMGGEDEWGAGMQASLAALDTLPNFRSYVGWGATHTILVTPLFYQMQVEDVPFRDWFAGLISGGSVEDVACEDCAGVELAGE
jgi:hypothetical protein